MNDTSQPVLPQVEIRGTGLKVTRLAYGCVPLGNYPDVISDAQAVAAVDCAYRQGIRYFDVAPLYGHGLAEHRLGTALRGRARDGFVVSTKVGRLLKAQPHGDLSGDQSAGIFRQPLPFSLVNDYTYNGIMRSVEDSLQRLGLAQIDLLHIHNIDPANHAPDQLEHLFRQCMDDGYHALEKLRSEGVIKAIGVGNNSLAMCERFVAEGDFDCIMMAGHFNLLDQPALARFFPQCAKKGTRVLAGSPFASGLLAADNPAQSLYMYGKPPAEVLEKVARIEGICRDHGVSKRAVALQFPLLHPVVACVVPGMTSVTEVEDCVARFREPLPRALFRDMQADGLLPEELNI